MVLFGPCRRRILRGRREPDHRRSVRWCSSIGSRRCHRHHRQVRLHRRRSCLVHSCLTVAPAVAVCSVRHEAGRLSSGGGGGGGFNGGASPAGYVRLQEEQRTVPATTMPAVVPRLSSRRPLPSPGATRIVIGIVIGIVIVIAIERLVRRLQPSRRLRRCRRLNLRSSRRPS